MDATRYSVDRRDIRFVQKEFLRVQDLAKLGGDLPGEEEIDMIVTEGATFVEEVMAPLNKSGDQQGARLVDGQVVTPQGFKEAWRQAGENGWVGITGDAGHGGQGLPLSVAIGVQEAMYGANPSLYNTMMLTAGAAGLIVRFGDEQQRATFPEKMFSGVWGGTMCLSEPHAGSAVGDITTKAVPTGDGKTYRLKGTKCWITGGDHDFTENIVHLVLARVEGAPAGTKGISLFIVPKFRLDAAGKPTVPNDVTTVSLEHKLGIKASPTCVLEFGARDDCHGYLLEGENRGMAQMFTLMNEARLVVAYQGLGAASGAYRNALAYARDRQQGVAVEAGKDPNAPRTAIVNHPDVRNMLLTMKATVEGVRGLIYSLAWCTDQMHHAPESERQRWLDLVDILTPIAKNAGADQGYEAIRLGVQVLGGVGFTEEFPLAQALRDAKIASIYEGTTGIQALDLVTRKLRLRGGALYRTLREELDTLQADAAQGEGLRRAIAAWRETCGSLDGVVQAIAGIAEERGPREGVFNATDVTVMFGDVVCGYYLLKMALVAEQALARLGHAPGNGGMDALRAVALDNEDVAFYFNKIKTAEHHVHQILPRTQAIAAKVHSRDFAALEAVL